MKCWTLPKAVRGKSSTKNDIARHLEAGD